MDINVVHGDFCNVMSSRRANATARADCEGKPLLRVHHNQVVHIHGSGRWLFTEG